jgi:hypothetical protein
LLRRERAAALFSCGESLKPFPPARENEAKALLAAVNREQPWLGDKIHFRDLLMGDRANRLENVCGFGKYKAVTDDF